MVTNSRRAKTETRRARAPKQRDIVFRAIAAPTRRQILNLLRDGEQPVGVIAAHFRVSRPAISKHLRLLISAGLVVTRRQGTSQQCTLNAAPLKEVNAWLGSYEQFWSESMQSLKEFVEKPR